MHQWQLCLFIGCSDLAITMTFLAARACVGSENEKNLTAIERLLGPLVSHSSTTPDCPGLVIHQSQNVMEFLLPFSLDLQAKST